MLRGMIAIYLCADGSVDGELSHCMTWWLLVSALSQMTNWKLNSAIVKIPDSSPSVLTNLACHIDLNVIWNSIQCGLLLMLFREYTVILWPAHAASKYLVQKQKHKSRYHASRFLKSFIKNWQDSRAFYAWKTSLIGQQGEHTTDSAKTNT